MQSDMDKPVFYLMDTPGPAFSAPKPAELLGKRARIQRIVELRAEYDRVTKELEQYPSDSDDEPELVSEAPAGAQAGAQAGAPKPEVVDLTLDSDSESDSSSSGSSSGSSSSGSTSSDDGESIDEAEEKSESSEPGTEDRAFVDDRASEDMSSLSEYSDGCPRCGRITPGEHDVECFHYDAEEAAMRDNIFSL